MPQLPRTRTKRLSPSNRTATQSLLMAAAKQQLAVPLRAEVTCPNCWDSFPPEDSLWISQHPDLLGDARLGSDHQIRFLPTRFNVEGDAIDARGFACHSLACPRCHLHIPPRCWSCRPYFSRSWVRRPRASRIS